MSSREYSLVTWPDFLKLPDRPEHAKRYELHDGEIVTVPPARPIHIKLQKRIERLLEAQAGERGVVAIEFPYRPAVNLQYWFADVAFVPQADWDALPPHEYSVYAPLLIVVLLSLSNTPAKVNRERIVAMSAGTEEFWVVDPEARAVQVTNLMGARMYGSGDTISLAIFSGVVSVDQIFGS